MKLIIALKAKMMDILNAVPAERLEAEKENSKRLHYLLAITDAPLWHGPWKERKDGTGKYRSVKIAKVVQSWRSQKVSYGNNFAYDPDPCEPRDSWYDHIPVCPWAEPVIEEDDSDIPF